MNKQTALANKLKELRASKFLSLRDVEKRTGISNSYICKLENGKFESAGFFLVSKLLKFYGVKEIRL